VAVLLGLVVAASFGSGDFLGGRASARAATVTVLLIVQAVAVVGGIVVALAVSARVGGADIAYGAGAGVANAAGVGLLYHGLARARVGVVAPLTAVVAALVPVGWALARGERPSALVLVGAACAITAGALIAREHDEAQPGALRTRGVPIAIAAGVCLGTSLVCLSETSDGSGFWPVLAARVAGLLVVGVVFAVLFTRSAVSLPDRAGTRLACGAGVLDFTATAMLLAAIRHGLLVVVAPVASLAPAFTVMWASVVLHERVSREQYLGLGLALVGLVLVASG
jgi:drug/metabolite transporter (DMT)-like permease